MRRPDEVSWRGWKLIKSTPWKWTLLSYPRCQTSFAPHHLACWNCSSTNSNAKPFCLTSNEWETCDFRRLWRLKLVCGTNRTWQWPNIQDQMDQIKETQRLYHLSQLGVSVGLQAKALLWGPLSALCSLQEVNSAGPFKANAIANEHHQPGVSETLEEQSCIWVSSHPSRACGLELAFSSTVWRKSGKSWEEFMREKKNKNNLWSWELWSPYKLHLHHACNNMQQPCPQHEGILRTFQDSAGNRAAPRGKRSAGSA